jgi:hypothetical protein
MKKLIVLLVLVVILAGCDNAFRQDETGSSPFLEGVAVARKTNAVSAPINPYAGIIEIGLGMLTLAAGGGYVLKNKQLAKSDKKYRAHRQAGERIMRSKEPVKPMDVYAIIGEEREKVGL